MDDLLPLYLIKHIFLNNNFSRRFDALFIQYSIFSFLVRSLEKVNITTYSHVLFKNRFVSSTYNKTGLMCNEVMQFQEQHKSWFSQN